jgi:DegV family protein with EDD domain
VTVRIVCDSTADLDAAFLAAHSVTVVPLKVIIGDEVLEDGVDIQPSELYARMQSSTLMPRTSQPTPAEFETVFARLTATGDPLVCTTISAGLSGTYTSAVQARAALPERDIRVLDSRSVAVGHYAVAIAAVRAAESGAGPERVEAAATGVIASQRLLFTVETLEYLRRGGRIGGARALLGSVLDVKPILEIRDGLIEAADRVRTYSRAIERLAQDVAGAAAEWGGAAVVVGHAARPEIAAQLADRIQPSIGGTELTVIEVGPVIGVHGGPGAIGVSFHPPTP